VAFEPLGRVGATRAGVAWREHRQVGGPRKRVIADSLVGAHAVEQADRLLTRDRGFHRLAFAGLAIVDPSVLGE
jgi:predicted nucleic acid-binding protein